MDDSKRIEQLRFVLTRFDHYTEGANSKGNFLLAFCGFLVGFVGSNYSEIIAINDNAYEMLTGILIFNRFYYHSSFPIFKKQQFQQQKISLSDFF